MTDTKMHFVNGSSVDVAGDPATVALKLWGEQETEAAPASFDGPDGKVHVNPATVTHVEAVDAADSAARLAALLTTFATLNGLDPASPEVRKAGRAALGAMLPPSPAGGDTT